MRVEYDESLGQFRIYESEFASQYTTANYSGRVRSFEVVSDNTFEVVGEFGQVDVFNADGRIVS